jgi:small subunit ribosomal protein S20
LPNIKSAEKRVKISEKRALQNRVIKTGLKSRVKKLNAAVEAKDADKTAALYKEVSGAFDKAASKGTIHKNKANRKKSRLAKAISNASVS